MKKSEKKWKKVKKVKKSEKKEKNISTQSLLTNQGGREPFLLRFGSEKSKTK